MELFKILGRIAIDNSGANSAMDETTEKASKVSKVFSAVGSAAVTAGKTIGAGLAVGAAGVVALGKKALDGYADYEQLVGGVETLFKDSAAKVKEYAAAAYETAGLSANEYMETVTSFSAALIQSLNGDTVKAAAAADRAIIDMADNANKMGSSIESIQNAYQGFAKQNYTMLDNLKLGYGGTKEEMQRLLDDAKKISGIEYDLSSYADVVDAIHVIQEEMGIAGATANEASTTISGSLSAMKSAFTNLVNGLGDEKADLNNLIGSFVDSVITAAKNIIPRLEVILGGIGDVLVQLMPVIAESLPALLEELLPPLIEGAVILFNGLVAALPTLLPILTEQLPFILTSIGQALIAVFPVLLNTVKQLFGQIWDYIAVELLGTSANFDSTFAQIKKIFEDVWVALQYAWETVGQPIWNMIQSTIEIVRDAFSERMPEIMEFVRSSFSDISVFWNEHLKPCFEAIGNFIENVLAPIFENIFKNRISSAIEGTFTFIKGLWNDVLKPVLTGIIDFITGVFTLDFGKALGGIESLTSGLRNSIILIVEGMINTAITGLNTLIGLANGLVESAGDVLGISFSIPMIPTVTLPKLAKGGVLEKGQVGLLEGSGAEAVVPLENNSKWISRVAEDLNGAMGSGANGTLDAILQEMRFLNENLAGIIGDALDSTSFNINNREFARLVKAVN